MAQDRQQRDERGTRPSRVSPRAVPRRDPGQRQRRVGRVVRRAQQPLRVADEPVDDRRRRKQRLDRELVRLPFAHPKVAGFGGSPAASSLRSSRSTLSSRRNVPASSAGPTSSEIVGLGPSAVDVQRGERASAMSRVKGALPAGRVIDSGPTSQRVSGSWSRPAASGSCHGCTNSAGSPARARPRRRARAATGTPRPPGSPTPRGATVLATASPGRRRARAPRRCLPGPDPATG